MKTLSRLRRRRAGLAPIISTVLVIAITLVTSVAVGGFVYGTLGSSANSAQVGVTDAMVPASVGVGVNYAYCAVSNGNSVGDGFIALYNSGTGATNANTFQLVYDGATVNVALTGTCTVMPDTTIYVVIIALAYFTSPGVMYTGFVSMGNGAEVLYTGDFN